MTALVRLPFRLVRAGASLGLEAVRFVDRRVRGEEQAPPAPPASTPMPPSIVDTAPVTPDPAEAAADAAPRAPEPPQVPDGVQPEFEERHIDAEAEEVASFGPEADAGATVTVAAPWSDYDDMGAQDVVERVRDADDTTKAAVVLYESQGRNRKTVLAAAGG